MPDLCADRWKRKCWPQEENSGRTIPPSCQDTPFLPLVLRGSSFVRPFLAGRGDVEALHDVVMMEPSWSRSVSGRGMALSSDCSLFHLINVA